MAPRFCTDPSVSARDISIRLLCDVLFSDGGVPLRFRLNAMVAQLQERLRQRRA